MTVGAPAPGVDRRPYIGARPFGSRDAHRFFGRGPESAELAELWRARRLTVLHGPSGVGRTSLLNAGVLARLEPARAEVVPVAGVSVRLTAPGSEPLPALVAIDQAERLPSLDRLARLLEERTDLHLLLSVREDRLDALLAGLGRLGYEPARFRLEPFSRAAAIEAARRPMEATDRSFAPGVAEAMVDDVGAGETGLVEPALLQVACSALWGALPDNLRVVTAERLRRYGDVTGSLTAFVGRVLVEVAEDHDVPTSVLHSWMRKTFAADHGVSPMVYEGPERTAAMPNSVLRALEDRHVLRGRWLSGSRVYQPLHERLIEPIQRATETAIGPADYLRAAELAYASGDLVLAEKHALEAMHSSLDTDLRLRAEAEVLLGDVALAQDRTAQAEIRYRAAAPLFEALQDTAAVGRMLAAVGRLWLAQGRPAEAVEKLRAATQRNPQDLAARTELARALWELGRRRAAVTIASGVLAVEGDSPEALRARGEFLADLGDAEGALRDLNRVREHSRPAARAARALALAILRQPNDAGPEIDAALSDAPGSGPVLLYAARVETLSGDTEAAADLARRAVTATDPALPPHQREDALRLLHQGPDDVPSEG